ARDAEELRRAAEAEAERLRDGVRQALQREETALRELRARRARLVQEYRAMLERELNELSVLLQTLEIAEEKDELSLGAEGVAAPSLSVEGGPVAAAGPARSEEHTSELQSRENLVCRLLLEKKKKSYRH